MVKKTPSSRAHEAGLGSRRSAVLFVGWITHKTRAILDVEESYSQPAMRADDKPQRPARRCPSPASPARQVDEVRSRATHPLGDAHGEAYAGRKACASSGRSADPADSASPARSAPRWRRGLPGLRSARRAAPSDPSAGGGPGRRPAAARRPRGRRRPGSSPACGPASAGRTARAGSWCCRAGRRLCSVEGLIGWFASPRASRAAFSTGAMFQIAAAAPGQLSPSAWRLASSAACSAFPSNSRIPGPMWPILPQRELFLPREAPAHPYRRLTVAGTVIPRLALPPFRK